jgi:L-lactate utilization protein LutB
MYDFVKIKANMEAKGYKVNVFETKESAAAYIDSQIDGKTVGFGGSVSLHQLDIFPLLTSHNTVYWHDEKPADMTVIETKTAATRAEVYISSVNGISENGDIVNLDNTGNRVAAITYGPEKVFLVIGKNKIAPTLEEAIYRVRNIASPLNAKRLNRKTPCAVNGDKCYNCQSPERICRNLSIFLDRPTGVEYDIVFVDEELGY